MNNKELNRVTYRQKQHIQAQERQYAKSMQSHGYNYLTQHEYQLYQQELNNRKFMTPEELAKSKLEFQKQEQVEFNEWKHFLQIAKNGWGTSSREKLCNKKWEGKQNRKDQFNDVIL